MFQRIVCTIEIDFSQLHISCPGQTNLLTPLLPLQMTTEIEETGGFVPLSELVTEVTTRRAVSESPHTPHILAHPHTVGGEVGYTTTTHTSVTQCFERCTRWGRHQWCGVCVRASSATLQHGIVPTNRPFPSLSQCSSPRSYEAAFQTGGDSYLMPIPRTTRKHNTQVRMCTHTHTHTTQPVP